MSNTSILLVLVGIVVCLLSQATCNIQYPNIDEETGCPTNVASVCEYCAEDQNRLGCYCELESGEVLVTANVFTPCPAKQVDPCSNNSCLNGGTCVRDGISDFKCQCTPGFGGLRCNETLPKCSDVVCFNSQCVETTNPLVPVYCQCYDGTQRDPRQNDTCPLSPCYVQNTAQPVCQNNGTCRIINNAHVCECTAGWAGQNCSRTLKTPLCESQPGVCGQGKCIQSLTPPFYSCNCGNHPSILGREITELYRCESSGCYAVNPCQNGGTCSNGKGPGTFTCQCSSRFTGSKCEKNSACFTNPCVNGGTCQPFNETVFFCKCPPYFTGQRCEIAVPDPCKGKVCGPFGECRDNRGVGVCLCNDGFHLDGSPCQDPCRNISCGIGVCTRKPNATFEAMCSCPVNRKGEFCELSNDVCRESPRCGGGFCKPNYASARGFSCVCEGGAVRQDPCPFSKTCPITNCGTEGICVETDGITIPPATRPVFYVCQCLKGYIAGSNCNDVLARALLPEIANRCGPNGKVYPSRNPGNPYGCWCNNGTHIEEIKADGPSQYCV